MAFDFGGRLLNDKFGCSVNNMATQGTRTLISDAPVVARLGDWGGEGWKVPAKNDFLDLHPGVGRKKQVNSSTHHTHPQGWQFLCWGLL